jgi:replicative DNA helicase
MALNIKIERRKPDLTTLVYGKVPPQAPELEEAVIGACLLERDTFEEVMQILHPECFYVDAHQKIYAAACIVYNEGRPVDLLTVTEQLRKSNELEIVGGAYALTNLTMAVLSTAHVVEHARIVFEKFVNRELIRISGSIISDAYEDSTDPFELHEMASKQLNAIFDGISGDSSVSVGDAYDKVIEAAEAQKESQSGIIGTPSGFDELDRLTLGWIDTDLIILAARPSQGKTAFAVNFAEQAAKVRNVRQKDGTIKQERTHVLLFSLESSAVSLTRRIAAAKLQIPMEQIRSGSLNEWQLGMMKQERATFKSMPIKIDSEARMARQIIKKGRAWRKKIPKHAKGLIIIDYLQLMKGSGKGNRENEVSEMSRDLKELAMELDVPIIALSQLNREVEKTGNKKPNLSHLRESGAIEQDANIVMFVWWEELPNGEKQLHLLVEKNREGKCGDVLLKMNGDFQKIMNMEESVEPVYPSIVSHALRDPSQSQQSWDDPF